MVRITGFDQPKPGKISYTIWATESDTNKKHRWDIDATGFIRTIKDAGFIKFMGAFRDLLGTEVIVGEPGDTFHPIEKMVDNSQRTFYDLSWLRDYLDPDYVYRDCPQCHGQLIFSDGSTDGSFLGHYNIRQLREKKKEIKAFMEEQKNDPTLHAYDRGFSTHPTCEVGYCRQLNCINDRIGKEPFLAGTKAIKFPKDPPPLELFSGWTIWAQDALHGLQLIRLLVTWKAFKGGYANAGYYFTSKLGGDIATDELSDEIFKAKDYIFILNDAATSRPDVVGVQLINKLQTRMKNKQPVFFIDEKWYDGSQLSRGPLSLYSRQGYLKVL